MKEYIKILGFPVRDAVTGFEGVATSVGFDLYGCVQVVVTPPTKEGKVGESMWFDHKRLNVTAESPVLIAPVFTMPSAERGPAEKPAALQAPRRG